MTDIKFLTMLPLLLKVFLTNPESPPMIENRASGDSIQRESQNVRIVFYNTENLYDPYDDTTKLDDDFTKQGMKRWSYSKFKVKLDHLAKTIIAVGGWKPPPIIGFSEIENRYVLNKLIYSTALKKFGYGIVHHESPDRRGVDVALLYLPEMFNLINSLAVRISFPFDTSSQTREILLVEGRVFQKDTIRILVNHWPSRLGGYTESQPKRLYVASVVRHLTDSLLANFPRSAIVIMGDFNDDPDGDAITSVLGAVPLSDTVPKTGLVNLMTRFLDHNAGTHRFQGRWSVLDQFIVSANLLRIEGPVYTTPEDVHIFTGDFLLEKDERYFGDKPLRTFSGPRYVGGFSDHLPVYIDIWRRNYKKLSTPGEDTLTK